MSKLISIKLFNHQSVWKPGDTILGQVCFASTVQADIQNVSISLEGKTKGYWNDGEKFKMRLFYLQQLLFRGPFTLLPSNMSWPFEFVIPTKWDWTSEHRLKDNLAFDTTGEQQLPPTFVSERDDSRVIIKYNLKASIWLGKMFSIKEFTIPIVIIPPRIHEPDQFGSLQIPHLFGIQTLHLDPHTKTRSLTLKERMRSTFKPETLPHHNFQVLLELPEAIENNSPINVVMHLEHSVRHSTATEIPTVTMSNFSLALELDVLVRTPGHRDGPSHQWTDSQEICNLWRPIPLSERLELSNLPLQRLGLNPTFRLQPNTAPTFTTHCIAIRYRWKAKFTLVCANKTLHGKTSMPCVVLGPQTNQSIASLPFQTGPSAIAASVPLEEEQLPAYSAEGVAIEMGL